MGKIFCVVGKSSTGKDTIYQRIMDQETGLKRIVPYTTRPIRDGEQEGVEYHFVSYEKKDALLEAGKVVEIRTYDTWYGPWDYFTVDDGNIDLDQDNYLMIGTLEAYTGIRRYFGQDRVTPIYIAVEDGERLQRALNREKKQEAPKYEEMCRRFLADQEDFSGEKLAAAGIDKTFWNVDLDETVDEVCRYISETR